jgi:hypothetical protein
MNDKLIKKLFSGRAFVLTLPKPMEPIQDLKSFIVSAEDDAAKRNKNGNKATCADAEKINSEAGSLVQLFTIERAFV